MVYDPTSNPSNQLGVASVTYKGEVWVFYYESAGDLNVLRGAEGNKYTKSQVLNENGQPIQIDEEAHPLAVTLRSDALRLYYLEKGDNNYLKELIIVDGQKNSTGNFNSLKLKSALPAVLMTTVINDTLKVYFTPQGGSKFSIASHHLDGSPWTVEPLEA